jgi:hypothetical protein
VAGSASKAHKLIQDLSEKNQMAENKLKELEATSQNAQETLDNLKETSMFNSLVAAAQNDDREAFEQLVEWVDKKESRFWQYAADAIIRIRTTYAGPIEPGYFNVDWPAGTIKEQLTLQILEKEYNAALTLYDFIGHSIIHQGGQNSHGLGCLRVCRLSSVHAPVSNLIKSLLHHRLGYRCHWLLKPDRKVEEDNLPVILKCVRF